jgi:hypothetical protein
MFAGFLRETQLISMLTIIDHILFYLKNMMNLSVMFLEILPKQEEKSIFINIQNNQIDKDYISKRFSKLINRDFKRIY